MSEENTPPDTGEEGPPPGHRQLQRRVDRKRDAEEIDRLQQEIEEVESYRMPLMDHLVELKDRLIRALAAVVVGSAIGFYYAKEIFDFLSTPFVAAMNEVEGVHMELVLVSSPFEGVYTWLKVGVIAGMLIASPVISYQVWQFVAPGLYKTERNVVLPLTVSTVALFFVGAAFCFYGIFPYAFPFFVEVLGVDASISVDGYLSTVIRMMFAFGACFQLPVAAWFMGRVGLVDHRDMIAGFRYAVVVIFVLAAIITPPDPLTQLLLGIPMVLLYGISIVITWMSSTKVRLDDEAPAAA